VLFGRGSENAVEAHVAEFLKKSHAKVWLKGGMLKMMPYMIEVQ
jgi:hypothetical protein